jgi:branched-chain amino acid aminotransferase
MYYTENTTLYLDGEFQAAGEAHANLYSQTLHYGYGVFEGIRSYQTSNGVKIFKAREHFERLSKSCELIGIPFDKSPEELTALSYELLKRNGFSDAYLRPLIFCGPNMSLTRPKDVHLLLCAWEWGAYLGEQMLKLMISRFCRPHPRSLHVEAKACGHYVNSILATAEAKDKGYDEGLLLDHEGFLAEGPGANLFFGTGQKLFTPLKGCILPGITRSTVISLCAELGFQVEEGKYTPTDLLKAEFAFYCGTAAEIVGIESVNGQKLPGFWPSTAGKLLQDAYTCKVREQKTKHLTTGA